MDGLSVRTTREEMGGSSASISVCWRRALCSVRDGEVEMCSVWQGCVRTNKPRDDRVADILKIQNLFWTTGAFQIEWTA